jgi:major outer membrane protein
LLVARQTSATSGAGVYPLQKVLDTPFISHSAPLGASRSSSVANLQKEVTSSTATDGIQSSARVNAEIEDGISPANWGDPLVESGQSPDMANAADDNAKWLTDPPALEPEPTPYELRKNEKNKSPGLLEILNKGRYFAAVETLWMEPHFLGSTALTQTTGTTVVAEPFDFGFNFSPRFTAGFESEMGPGLEFKYWNYNGESDRASFVSDGLTTGQTSLYLLGPERWTRITADASGESLSVEHELEAQSFNVAFFKEAEFKVGRINGELGLHYATLSHLLRARVADGGGSLIGELLGISEFEGFGPMIAIEYFRPVGHTKLEMLGGLQVSLLFGERDQLVQNTATLDFNRFSADELLSGLTGQIGVQYMHHLTEHRTIFARTAFEAQHWIGGGTATDPVSDFGIYGLTFGVGVNR